MHSGVYNDVAIRPSLFFFDVAGEVPTEKPSNKHERLGVAGLALHYAHIITQIDNIVSAILFFFF